MKIQCNVCEAAEAKVLCCADEAALCWPCDQKVHAANKLAGKHQRVPLTTSSSHLPKCDICQESSGYFFCLEDRALLCRKCDIAIHSANSYVSAHQRFLVTGVKVGSEPSEPEASYDEQQTSPSGKNAGCTSKSLSGRSPSLSISGETSQISRNEDLTSSRLSFPGGSMSGMTPIEDLPSSRLSFPGGAMSGMTPGWPLDEFFRFTGLNQNYGFMEHGSSKADSGNLGSLGGSPSYRSSEEELEIDCLGEIPFRVPEIQSPPTASGMYWPKNAINEFIEDSAFVPDICSDLQEQRHCPRSSPTPKRLRRF